MKGDFFVLKSVCIKTNNKCVINYLLKELDNINLNNIYVSKLKFKIYNNIIIHYKGKNIDDFFNKVSIILSSIIINFYEKNIIKSIINSNYFYFSDIEQQKILDVCHDSIFNNDFGETLFRQDIIKISFDNYLKNHKALILDGFVKFRLNEYIKFIDNIVDDSVNKFVIDREYLEFIELLKSYINSKEPGLNIVHLIYNNKQSILLDEFKDTIDLNYNIFNTKYVSDITFSSNYFALNTLLTLLPQKICIHVIDNFDDEFLNTLKLIFNDRIYLCSNCNICKIYKSEKMHQ